MNSGSVSDSVRSLFQKEFIFLCSSSNISTFRSVFIRVHHTVRMSTGATNDQTSLIRSSDLTVRRSSMAAYASWMSSSVYSLV